MENGILSIRQFRLIVTFSTMSTAFFLLPSVLIRNAKQHAWLVPIWAGVVGMVISMLWMFLVHKYPKLNCVQICKRILGNYVGTIVSLVLIFQMVLLCSWVMYNLDVYTVTTLLPHTASWILGASFLFICVYSTVKGIESIGRTAEFFTPILLVAFLILFLLSTKNWNWDNFTPLWVPDWNGIFNKSKIMVAYPYMDIFTFFMIYPYVKEKPTKTFLSGVVVAILFLSGIIFMTIGVLGVSRASHLNYPLFTIAQELSVNPFLEHLEATISILWKLIVFIKLSFTFYCATLGISDAFNVPNRDLISVPLAIIILGLSETMHKNIIDNVEWMYNYVLLQHSLFILPIPILLIIVHLIFKRRQSKCGY